MKIKRMVMNMMKNNTVNLKKMKTAVQVTLIQRLMLKKTEKVHIS